LGNGELCDFWKDMWCSNITLASLFPKLYTLSDNEDIIVCQAGYWNPNEWIWDLNLKKFKGQSD